MKTNKNEFMFVNGEFGRSCFKFQHIDNLLGWSSKSQKTLISLVRQPLTCFSRYAVVGPGSVIHYASGDSTVGGYQIDQGENKVAYAVGSALHTNST